MFVLWLMSMKINRLSQPDWQDSPQFNKLWWHHIATIPKLQDLRIRDCIGGSWGKPGVLADLEREQPPKSQQVCAASIVGQFENSSWNWEEFCSTQWQMGAKYACLKGLGQSGPHTLLTGPPAFPSGQGSHTRSGSQTEQDTEKRGKENGQQTHHVF